MNLVHTLKGHTLKIKVLHWSGDDRLILSAGKDGRLVCWDVISGRKLWEVEKGKNIFTSITSNQNSSMIYTTSSDGLMREYNSETGTLIQDFNTDTTSSQVVVSRSGKTILSVSPSGAIRGCNYPFSRSDSKTNELEKSQDINCHYGLINDVRFSYDETHFFSISNDGCLWVYKIDAPKRTELKKEKEIATSDDILVTKSEMIETLKEFEKLKNYVNVSLL